MKRAAVVALWVFSFWYLGNAIAFYLGISDLFGPFLGLATGLFVALDPNHVVTSRRITLRG